jgi:hypothetical protein
MRQQVEGVRPPLLGIGQAVEDGSEDVAHPSLTGRELEVLAPIAEGLSTHWRRYATPTGSWSYATPWARSCCVREVEEGFSKAPPPELRRCSTGSLGPMCWPACRQKRPQLGGKARAPCLSRSRLSRLNYVYNRRGETTTLPAGSMVTATIKMVPA